MRSKTYTFPTSTVQYYFNAAFSYLDELLANQHTIFIVDENYYKKNKAGFIGRAKILVKPGEENKIQETVSLIMEKLIEQGADRSTVLVGVGGGIVTDLAGYVATIYKRGLRFGFVPTTILAMADAAIGGKNGVNIGLHKNMAGTIRQPGFILYDYSLLKTLPKKEWINGFAEIIKHACIANAAMFKMLEKHDISFFQKNINELAKLVQANAVLKTNIVIQDEFEHGERKLLNFGHTVGHAIENLYHIPHGHAVSIGMVAACNISEQLTGFKDTARVAELLRQYGFAPAFSFDKRKTWELILSDKKRSSETIDYIVLDKIGNASVRRLPLQHLHQLIDKL